MNIFDNLLGSIVTCITSLPLIIVLLTLDVLPGVPSNAVLDQGQVNEVQQLLIDHDPRRLLASEFQEVRLTEPELNALTTYIKSNNPVFDAVNTRIGLDEDAVSVGLSIPLDLMGLQRYFNLTLGFTHINGKLVLKQLDAGALGLPAVILSPLGKVIASRLAEDPNYQLVSTFMNSLHFQNINARRMVIVLDWQGDNRQLLEDQARRAFVSAREAQRLVFYQEKLVDTIAALPESAGTIGLNDLFRPIFLFANINSVAGADPVAENRAAFIVLSTYLTDFNLEQLVGTDLDIPVSRPLKVVIERREDLARHVSGSAAISASAGASMAELLSVYKEVHDSRYRTGFSFTDIAANQAGSLLGMLATRSTEDALLFQQIMMDSESPGDYLPQLGTYDGMTEAEFIEQYGSRESEAYRMRLKNISDSIAARPFYQSFSR